MMMEIPQEAVSIQHNTKAAEPITAGKCYLYLSPGRGFDHLLHFFLYILDCLSTFATLTYYKTSHASKMSDDIYKYVLIVTGVGQLLPSIFSSEYDGNPHILFIHIDYNL